MSLYSHPISPAKDQVQDTRLARSYPDPFDTWSTLMVPETVSEVLKWAEKLWIRNGTYSRACKRVVSYFLTKVKVTDCSDSEREQYEDFLANILDVMSVLTDCGEDLLAYGNSFSSLIVPFRRMLRCEKCGTEWPIRRVEYKFQGRKFHWTCGNCNHHNHTEKPVDRRVRDKHKLRIKRWNPHHIRIRVHPISDRKEFYWAPPPMEAEKVKEGDPFYLNEYPWEMIEAILDDKLFQFNEDVIYHMADESLAGINANGWGLPPILHNFHQAYYIQLAKLYNEVLCQEYIVPFRVLSPAETPNVRGSDMAGGGSRVSMGSINKHLTSMLKKHRRNPGGWHVSPVPVQYQALGGEGVNLNTYDHISAATDEMLNAIGVPVELYKGTLNLQTLPTALRLFEQTWPHLVAAFNGWLDWLMDRLFETMGWEKAKARLQSVTWADDIERRHIIMQLMAAGKVSSEAVMSPLGLDYDEELEKIFDEQRRGTEEQQKFEAEMMQRQQIQELMNSGPAQAAGMAQGMAPGVPAAGGQMQAPGVTPGDLMAQAHQIAQQLAGADYATRRRELSKIQKTDQALHAAVKQQLEEIRNQAASQGKQMILQGQAG